MAQCIWRYATRRKILGSICLHQSTEQRSGLDPPETEEIRVTYVYITVCTHSLKIHNGM